MQFNLIIPPSEVIFLFHLFGLWWRTNLANPFVQLLGLLQMPKENRCSGLWRSPGKTDPGSSLIQGFGQLRILPSYVLMSLRPEVVDVNTSRTKSGVWVSTKLNWPILSFRFQVSFAFRPGARWLWRMWLLPKTMQTKTLSFRCGWNFGLVRFQSINLEQPKYLDFEIERARSEVRLDSFSSLKSRVRGRGCGDIICCRPPIFFR